MNGSASTGIVWDDVAILSSAGLGKAGTTKETYIAAGETVVIDGTHILAGYTPQDWLTQIMGVRATSVNGGDSLKLVDNVAAAISAADDTATVIEDGQVCGNVLDNDVERLGNTLKVMEFTVAGGTYAAGTTATITGQGELTLNQNGFFTFVPALNFNGTVSSVTYTATDADSVSSPLLGVTLSAELTIKVTSVNDAPAGTDATLTMPEDGTQVLMAADFGFSDTADTNSLLAAVKITTLPTAGTLTLNGQAVVAGTFVSIADIVDGKLAFAPAANANGTSYASLTFQVQDNGGTANGGVNLDQSANTLTFDVTSVNDAPNDISMLGSAVTENAAGAVIGTLSTTDVDNVSNFTYSVDDSRFEVVGSTLKLKNGVALDYEAAPSFAINITSTDLGGLAFTERFTITVNDVGENTNPLAGVDKIIVSQNTTAMLPFSVLLANDSDTETLSALTITAAAGASGAVSSVSVGLGMLSITTASVTSPQSTTTPNGSFTYTLDDGQAGTATGTVNVFVAPVGDGSADILDLGNYRPYEASYIDGGSRGDSLSGASLVGGLQRDWLFGGEGNDLLAGGKGDDVLTGGNGRDNFVFNPGDGQDMILDFEFSRNNGDRLDLDGSPYTTAFSGGNTVVSYVGDTGSSITIVGLNLTGIAASDWIV